MKTLIYPNGRTQCCSAFTSISEDGVEYCKACFNPVTGTAPYRPPIYHEYVEKLIEWGFRLDTETYEWKRGNERGRLSWSCNEDEAWLRFPGTRGAQEHLYTNAAHRITKAQVYAGGSGK